MTTTDPLANQVALITGGGTGIGLAIADDLARRGVRCALVGRRRHVLDEAVERLVTPGLAIAADVADAEAPESIVAAAHARLGSIDIVVHAAGVFDKSAVVDTSPELWDSTLALNLTAVMRLTQRAWPDLVSNSGQIVMISSIAAQQAFEGNAAYAASKGGLNSLAEVIALEGRDLGIRVITLLPAQTATPLWDGKAPAEVLARMLPPEGVGALTGNLLASDRAIDFSPIVVRPRRDPWENG